MNAQLLPPHSTSFAGTHAAGEQCVGIDHFFDLDLLNEVVPIHIHTRKHTRLDDHKLRPGVTVVRGYNSSMLRQKYPCSIAPALRRHVETFWFSQCGRTVQFRPLLAHVQRLLGAPPGAPTPNNVFLRSGLFYSQPIKAAVRAIRAAIGGEYYSVHVRRSDKLQSCSPKDCLERDRLTRPPALAKALGMWFPDGSRVYIGSTERPEFFTPLRQRCAATSLTHAAMSLVAAPSIPSRCIPPSSLQGAEVYVELIALDCRHFE